MSDPTNLAPLASLPLLQPVAAVAYAAPAQVVARPVAPPGAGMMPIAPAPRVGAGGAPPLPGGAGAARKPRGSVDDRELWHRINRPGGLRAEVAGRLTSALAASDSDVDREMLGRRLIAQVVREEHDKELAAGRSGWSPTYSARLTQALFDVLFRLGRLQPLVELEGAEDIEGYGCDRVFVTFGDGRIEQAQPVADSDEELIEFFQQLATRDPANERSFTRANWSLDLDLPGRARLAVLGWVTPRPTFTIRLQRLKDVDLAMLQANGTIDGVLWHFLTAAVRARKSIVISGRGQGSGKTTFLRALCSALDPDEKVGTIETDYELYLHEAPHRHRRVVAMRSREGTGEMMANGHRTGAVHTGALIHPSLRQTLDRIIVGEVRGKEIGAMFEAMQAGNGSLSTVHADSAEEVVERLVGLAVQDSSVSETYAYKQVVQSIDLIVYLSNDKDEAGRKRRFVSKVIEVSKGERENPVAISPIFVPGPGGRAIPLDVPSFIDDLVAAGFDRTLMAHRVGTWGLR